MGLQVSGFLKVLWLFDFLFFVLVGKTSSLGLPKGSRNACCVANPFGSIRSCPKLELISRLLTKVDVSRIQQKHLKTWTKSFNYSHCHLLS